MGCTHTTTAVSAARYCLFSAAHMGMYRQAANHALQAILGDERGICGRLLCACLLVPRLPCSPACSCSQNEVRNPNLVASCSRQLPAAVLLILCAPADCLPLVRRPSAMWLPTVCHMAAVGQERKIAF